MSCITLLSDLGSQDASVAIARGVLLQLNSDAALIDITHDITPFHTQQAAYLLRRAYKKFPPGTFHVALFNIFSEASPKLTLSKFQGQYFLSPDNGIIPMALGNNPQDAWHYTGLSAAPTFDDWVRATGKIITQLVAKRPAETQLAKIGLKIIAQGGPSTGNTDFIPCDIIHVDNFENVVLDITRDKFEQVSNSRQFRLQFMSVEEIAEINSGYHEVREGFKLCRFNSEGYLEICINRGKAASLFGLRLGGGHNDIKLIFE